MDYGQIIQDIYKKIDKMSRPAALWVNAETIKEKTGLSDDGMRRLRQDNPDIWKLKKTGGYLYNISALPPVMLKQKEIV